MKENKATLLILAAGMGSRYGGLKQLDQVGPSGETIIDYSIFDAIRAGFGKIVFVIRRDIEDAFREQIGNKYSDKIKVDYAFQELDALPGGFELPEGRVKPWGTGHAILCAKDVINEPFAVINGDDFYGHNSFQIMKDYLAVAKDTEYCDFCMVGYKLENTLSEYGTVSRGVCNIDGNNNLISATELTKLKPVEGGVVNEAEGEAITDLKGDEIVSMNMWGFTPSVFDHLESMFVDFLKEKIAVEKSEYFIPTAVNDLINGNKAKVEVLTSPDKWFGVTYKEDKEHVINTVNGLVAEGTYPKSVFEEL